MATAGAGCELGCWPSGLDGEESCLRRVVEGICICHCHRPVEDVPHPVTGYAPLFPSRPRRQDRPR